MPADDSRAELLAIAALYAATDEARAAPLKPSLWLRALLAMLYSRRKAGDQEPYRNFWQAVTGGASVGADTPYKRATYGRTYWAQIVRAAGLEPQSEDLHTAIRDLTSPTLAPAHSYFLEGAWVREIIATKGHPRSPGARKFMERNIAEGRMADGSDWDGLR